MHGHENNWNRRDWILLLTLTLLAALLRLYQLGDVPPGFQFDEAFNANDAEQVLAGNLPLFLPANGGREALYTYWQAALSALFGLNVYTLRLASALMGILAVPASYLLCRTILHKQSQAIAAFTALTLTISLWHIHFSHYGIRVIMMPVVLSGVFVFYWLGTHGRHKSTQWVGYLLSGILTGLSVWTHPAGRFVPFVLILYTAWLYVRHPQNRKFMGQHPVTNPIIGLIVTGVVAFLVFLPLGIEFYQNPDFFWGHASEVSIFAQRVSEGTPTQILLNNLGRVLGMFSIAGDLDWTHNLRGRPVFDILLSLPFYIGLLLWGRRLLSGWTHRQDSDVDALALLGFWFLIMLLPSVLSEAAPNYSRTLPSLPAAFVAVGLGLSWITTIRQPVAWLGGGLAAVILLFSSGSTVYDYFVRFAQSEELYHIYDVDKLDALDYLSQFTDTHQVYISQLWGDKHATVLLQRDKLGIQSVDIADTIVLPPPGKGAVYAFPEEQRRRAQQVADLWLAQNPDTANTDIIVEEIMTPYGDLLITNAILAPEIARQWPLGYQHIQPLNAHFFDSPTLVGVQVTENSNEVVLVWRHDARTYRDLTAFIHLIDIEGHQIGQADKVPGNGSYRTPFWAIGERVIDRYPVGINDPCAGGEEGRLLVGWYEWLGNNRRMARTDAPGDTAFAGTMTMPLVSQVRTRFAQQPANPLEAQFENGLTGLILWGYDQREAELQPGAPLTLNLYWQGDAQFNDIPIQLNLTTNAQPDNTQPDNTQPDNEQTTNLWAGQIAPQARWDPGEVICRRLRLRLPNDIAAGDYGLHLTFNPQGNTQQTISLTTLTLAESTRTFDPPPLHQTVNAQFGTAEADDVMRLLGFVEPPSVVDGVERPTLQVVIAWQAVQIPPESYKVFIHLLDETGQIVAQSDAVPSDGSNSGYATNRWIQGEVVLDTHLIQLPENFNLNEHTYRLATGLYEPASGQRLLAVDENSQPLPNNMVDLGDVILE
ncbi:MAG: phospholipid carrier-dependent glycosyltransferase [Chloroflexota bacterium]